MCLFSLCDQVCVCIFNSTCASIYTYNIRRNYSLGTGAAAVAAAATTATQSVHGHTCKTTLDVDVRNSIGNHLCAVSRNTPHSAALATNIAVAIACGVLPASKTINGCAVGCCVRCMCCVYISLPFKRYGEKCAVLSIRSFVIARQWSMMNALSFAMCTVGWQARCFREIVHCIQLLTILHFSLAF